MHKPIPCLVLTNEAASTTLIRASAAFGCVPAYAIAATTDDARFLAELKSYKFTAQTKTCMTVVIYNADAGLHAHELDISSTLALVRTLQSHFNAAASDNREPFPSPVLAG